MKVRMAAVTAAILGLALTASSCGGGDGGGEASRTALKPTPAPLPERVVVRADRNCRWMLRSVERVGERAGHTEYRSGLELTTEGIAKPGLALMRHLAKKQGTLQAAAADPRFDAYVELFDPIIVLGEQRLEAGQAGDEDRAKQLQELLTGLGAEQREAAAGAGLKACDLDFLDVVVRKAFG
jgi:hypothetical protein